jgi:hypothetical protein
LGHSQLSADGAHIGHFDHMNSDLAALALGMFAGLGEAFDQFLAEFVHAVLVDARKLLSAVLQALVPFALHQVRRRRAVPSRGSSAGKAALLDHGKVDDAHSASLAAAVPTPPDLADAPTRWDQIAGLGACAL